MKKSDDIITVKAELPAYGGLALARGNGSILLIKNAIPGETVEVKIDDQKKDFAFASATRVLAASPDRTDPACKYFGECGGCQLQYVSYQRQVSMKEEILIDCLCRIAKIEADLSDAFVGETPWNYRYRGQFKIGQNSMGFYREKTRDVVDIDYCPLMNNSVNDLFSKASQLHKSNAGLFKGISDIHISHGDKGIALLKSTERIASATWQKMAAALMEVGFKGVCGESEMGKTKFAHFGERAIVLNLDGLSYTVSPQSFFQSHWSLNCEVVRFLRQNLSPLNGKRVIDLYAGAGNFSLPLAFDSADVYAVEENIVATEDGRKNALANGIRNCRFVECSAERLKVCDTVDILVVDPPRPGLTNGALEKILILEPERIVYVSCNPSTLARDIKKLLGQYNIESLRVIDFFPQTYHIESIAVLRLR